MKRVGLVTYRGCSQLSEDDQLLLPLLRVKGIEAQPVIWDDAKVDWAAFDQVIIRSCWDYHLRLPEFLAWVSVLQSSNVKLQNSTQLVRWNSDKHYLRQLEAMGVRVPDTVWLEEGEERQVGDILRTRDWDCAVVKPTVSATAYRTQRVTHGESGQTVCGPLMVQQFLPEVILRGEWSLIFIDGKYSHAVRKFPAEKDFRVQIQFGGRVESAAASAYFIQEASAIVDQLPEPVLYARVDGVERNGEFLLMELELIEPVLFLSLCAAAEKLAKAIAAAVQRDTLGVA